MNGLVGNKTSQIVRENLGGGKPPLRLPCQATFDEDFKVTSMFDVTEVWHLRNFLADSFQEGLWSRLFTGRLQRVWVIAVRRNFVQHDAERPHVGRLAHLFRYTASPCLLRRHVFQGADNVSREGDRSVGPTRPIDARHAANAKIKDMRLAITFDQDISWFQIAVNDSGRVRIGNRKANAAQYGQPILEIQF